MNQIMNDRLNRLTGDGVSEKSGGGLPLPSMLQTALEFVYDHQSAKLPQIRTAVERVTLNKANRLERIYNKIYKLSGEPFELCTKDILDQMVDSGIIEVQDDCYSATGPNFKLHEPLKVTPKRKNVQPCHVQIMPPEQRQFVNEVSLNMLEVASLANELKYPDGGGIRPIDQDTVARLVQSMQTFGYIKEHPVLKDQYERILSGRHRIIAAKKANEEYQWREVNVDSDLEALAIAYTANEGSSFSKRERDNIARRLGVELEDIGKAIGREGMHRTVRAALTEHPDWSDRKLAEIAKVSHHTVGSIRAELDLTGQIAQLNLRTGADGKTRAPKGKLNANEQAVKDGLIASGGSSIAEELAALLNKPRDRVHPALARLMKKGLVCKNGKKKVNGKNYTVYALVKDDDQHKSKQVEEDDDPDDKIIRQMVRLGEKLTSPEAIKRACRALEALI